LYFEPNCKPVLAHVDPAQPFGESPLVCLVARSLFDRAARIVEPCGRRTEW
jgi:hypothetical protein